LWVFVLVVISDDQPRPVDDPQMAVCFAANINDAGAQFAKPCGADVFV